MLRTSDDLIPPTGAVELHQFVTYWIEKAAGRAMPAFSNIDPVEIPRLLRKIYVVRVIDGGADFVYRLAGEQISDRYDGRVAGRRIGDLLAPAAAEGIQACWRRMLRSASGYYSIVQHLRPEGMPLLAQRVTLPLGPAGGPPDHIVGITVFEAIGGQVRGPIDERVEHEVKWVSLGD